MKQSITCKICGKETEVGHGYQLPELLSLHIEKNHPNEFKLLCRIRQESDKLEEQSKSFGVYHRDLFYYRPNRTITLDVMHPKSGKLKLK